jgi:hypothetical protein
METRRTGRMQINQARAHFGKKSAKNGISRLPAKLREKEVRLEATRMHPRDAPARPQYDSLKYSFTISS